MTQISLLADGDCGPAHGPQDGFPLERYTELIRPVLATADLRFVNCMRQYSTRGIGNERALLAKAVLAKAGIKRVSFLPMVIDSHYRPAALRNGDPRFADAVRYMEWTSEGFDHKFTIEDDEVIVSG